jgi:hypothetical protein
MGKYNDNMALRSREQIIAQLLELCKTGITKTKLKSSLSISSIVLSLSVESEPLNTYLMEL